MPDQVAWFEMNATVEREGERRIGKVFPERSHAVLVGSPTQAWRTPRYVLMNWLRHGQDVGVDEQFWVVDWYSSAPSFKGWKEGVVEIPKGYEPLPVSEPRGWLLRAGWKKIGELALTDRPGPRRS